MLADDLTLAQVKAFRILANRSAAWAEWDEKLLSEEFADLSEAGFDLALTGFSDDELADLLGNVDSDDETNLPMGGLTEDADEDIPEAPVVPVSRPGDIWQLGAHRLICGDSTDPAVVAALMAGDRANLCFTSPPYGQQRDYTQGPGMPGDWAGRLSPSFEFVFHFNRQSRKPNKIVPCKHAGQDSHLRADGSSTAMRGKDGVVGGWTHAGQPTQDYRIPDSVIRIMRHKGKIGRDIELAPSYTDVAVKRFQQNHPDIPVILLATRQTFAEVEQERLVSSGIGLAETRSDPLSPDRRSGVPA